MRQVVGGSEFWRSGRGAGFGTGMPDPVPPPSVTSCSVRNPPRALALRRAWCSSALRARPASGPDRWRSMRSVAWASVRYQCAWAVPGPLVPGVSLRAPSWRALRARVSVQQPRMAATWLSFTSLGIDVCCMYLMIRRTAVSCRASALSRIAGYNPRFLGTSPLLRTRVLCTMPTGASGRNH